jgi:steroid delta-isomerase
MPTPDELRSAIATYAETINARDAEAIAALFTEDAVQADPADQPANVGHEAIAAFFAGGIAASDGWTFTATDVHTCADTVAITFQIAIAMGGSTMTIRGIEVFEAAADGRFSSVHAYWDAADVTMA